METSSVLLGMYRSSLNTITQSKSFGFLFAEIKDSTIYSLNFKDVTNSHQIYNFELDFRIEQNYNDEFLNIFIIFLFLVASKEGIASELSIQKLIDEDREERLGEIVLLRKKS